MDQEFDLTTRDGMKRAIDTAQKYIGPNLIFWVARKILDATKPAAAATTQAEAAAELIKSGKQNGVDKMTIVMDEQAGAHFSCPLEGVNVSAGIGSKGKIKIDVTYK
ncbi:hypothetical protein K5D34_21105 [Pseudomonas cichorii]|nr:hypothetical protein [Pseudomonas cichorii]MBX8512185.1 hypothetical protein [Pseudomonas cichorii]MBX8527166.1 hypothetical protein [Pseudomonas cichorii]